MPDSVTSKRWGNGARVDSINKGRDKLLRAAITCFVAKGVKATTIEDVASAANVTRRTVYRYYKGKNELIAAVVDLERRRLFDALEQACQDFQQDFPRMIEECVVRGAEILSPIQGGPDLISHGNSAEAMPHLNNTRVQDEWQRLFGAAYEHYRSQHPEVGNLEDIVEIVGRILISFRDVPAESDQIRRALNGFLTLPGQRY